MTAPEAVVAEPVESTRSTTRSAQQMAEDEGLTLHRSAGYSEGGDVHGPHWRPRPDCRPASPIALRGCPPTGTDARKVMSSRPSTAWAPRLRAHARSVALPR